MTLKKTPCCALLFMIAKDYDDINVMYAKLKKKQKQIEQVNWYGYGRGETTIQCIVLPTETKLKKNLVKLGFRKKLIFSRRAVSCKESNTKELNMYILNLKNLKNI